MQLRSGIALGGLVGGRYRLGEVIGRGGMADVYRGMDERLERPVAIKFLRPEMAARDDIRLRFQAEARAAAGLTHPNAVAVFDTGEHEGVPFLVMECLPGETLADRIAAGSVDPDWLRRAAVGVLGALDAAHAAGIVHRDVKPGNILIAADGTAKIADFGIAKSLPTADGEHLDLTATGQLLGTPAYLAPERLEGAPASLRSDLWALGVVLYEALAGQKPFDGPNPLAVARAVADGTYPPLASLRPDLDPHFVATVEGAMAHDPADRFPSAAEMAAALDGATAPVDTTVEGRPGGTLILPAGAAARRPAPRRPGLAWVLAALAVLALVLFLLARSGERPRLSAVGSGPATTEAPTTAPALQSLSQRLRAFADRLTARDGARAGDLATGLRQVAADLDAGSPAGGGHATGLIISAGAWNQTGQLSDAATAGAVQLLLEIPGVQQPSAPAATAPPSTTSAPAVTVTPTAPEVEINTGEGGGNGKGRGKGNGGSGGGGRGGGGGGKD